MARSSPSVPLRASSGSWVTPPLPISRGMVGGLARKGHLLTSLERPTGDRVRGAGEQLETAYQVYVWIPPAQQRHGRTPFRYPGGLPTTGVGKRLAGYFTGRACQSCRPMAEMGPPCVCPPVELR